MIVSRLLSKVPKNVYLPMDPHLQRSGKRHTFMVNMIGGVFCCWIMTTMMSLFPITFSGPMLETRVMPDYASGKVYTEFRTRERYFESI